MRSAASFSRPLPSLHRPARRRGSSRAASVSAASARVAPASSAAATFSAASARATRSSPRRPSRRRDLLRGVLLAGRDLLRGVLLERRDLLGSLRADRGDLGGRLRVPPPPLCASRSALELRSELGERGLVRRCRRGCRFVVLLAERLDASARARYDARCASSWCARCSVASFDSCSLVSAFSRVGDRLGGRLGSRALRLLERRLLRRRRPLRARACDALRLGQRRLASLPLDLDVLRVLFLQRREVGVARRDLLARASRGARRAPSWRPRSRLCARSARRLKSSPAFFACSLSAWSDSSLS